MSSIHWPPDLYDELRAHARTSGRQITEILHDALVAIATDPAAALVTAQPHLTACGTGPGRPLRGSNPEAFREARAALDTAFGGTVGVAPVVRGLVAARLAREAAHSAA